MSYLELGFGDAMLNLEAVVYGMWLDDRHRPSDRVDEGRGRGRGRGMVGIVAACRDAEKSLVRHGGRIRKVGCVERNRKICHRSEKDQPVKCFELEERANEKRREGMASWRVVMSTPDTPYMSCVLMIIFITTVLQIINVSL